jgi:hypothetical protein
VYDHPTVGMSLSTGADLSLNGRRRLRETFLPRKRGHAHSRLIRCRRKTMLRPLVFIPALTIGLAMPAIAADLPKEGNYDFTNCWSGIAVSIR